MAPRARSALALGALSLLLLVASVSGAGSLAEAPLPAPTYEPAPDGPFAIAMRIGGSNTLINVVHLAEVGALEMAAETLATIERPYGNRFWVDRMGARLVRSGDPALALALATLAAEGGGGRYGLGRLLTGYVTTPLTEITAAIVGWEESPAKAQNLAYLAEAHHRRGADAEARRLADLAHASLSGAENPHRWGAVGVARALALVGKKEEAAAIAMVVEEEYRQELSEDDDGSTSLYTDDAVVRVAGAWAAAGDARRAIGFVNLATDCGSGLEGFFCRVGEAIHSGVRKGDAAKEVAEEFARAGDRRSFSRVARFLRDDERLDLSMLLADRLLDTGLVAAAASVAQAALKRAAKRLPRGGLWSSRLAPELPLRMADAGHGALGRRLASASSARGYHATDFGLGHLLDQARASAAVGDYFAPVVRGLGRYAGDRAKEAEVVLLAGAAAVSDRVFGSESEIEAALALAALGRTAAATEMLAAAEARLLANKAAYFTGSRAGRMALVSALLGAEAAADERLAAVLASQQAGPWDNLVATLREVGAAAAWYGIEMGPKTERVLADILRRFEGCGHWEEMASGLSSARLCPQRWSLPEYAAWRFKGNGSLVLRLAGWGMTSETEVSLPSLETISSPWVEVKAVAGRASGISGDDEGIVLHWEPGSRTVLPGSAGLRLGTNGIGFSTSGDYIYAVGKDGLIRAWSKLHPEEDPQIWEPAGEDGYLVGPSGPDGYLVGARRDWVDLLIPGQEPEPIYRGSEHGEGGWFVSHHYPTRSFAVDTNAALEVWREGTLVGSLEHSARTLSLQALRLPTGLDVAWSPDGRLMLVFRHGSQYLWDLENGSNGLDAMAGRARGGAFSDDGRWLVVWADEVRIWDLSALDSTHD